MRKKRVWCLYRVSSKGQVSAEDDIPMQKNACHNFVNAHPDWEITKELYEKGVSGWLIKAEDRDEMVAIKDGAAKKEFDVLLVFMYDRLGRREDETPLVVQFLINEGVEVWSVNEGQTKIEGHTDILLNYIRFWQSSSESKKTSERSIAGINTRNEEGAYVGGSAPIGYEIIVTDTTHWKVQDKFARELVINESEAEMVKLIFRLYIESHMGFHKIVNYLNEKGYRNRKGGLIARATVSSILRNPVYTGRKRYKNGINGRITTQPQNEKLRIISDETFEMAIQLIKAKKPDRRKEEERAEIPRSGMLMFSGLAYCKYCNGRLFGSYTYKKRFQNTDSTERLAIYRYICPVNRGKHEGNHKQYLWGGKKYDKIIIKQIKEIIGQVDVESFIDASVDQREVEIKQLENNINNFKKEIIEYNEEYKELNAEMGRVFRGKSKLFTKEQLSNALTSVEDEIKQTTETMNALIEEVEIKKENFADVNYVASELNNWEQKFNAADDDKQKAMLSRIIDKVYFAKGEIEIVFNLALQECLQDKEKEISL